MIQREHPNDYRLVYMNPETGLMCIVMPTGESPLSFIKKVAVPQGVPFWIVNQNEIPGDRSFRDAWEIDLATAGDPDGYGGE
jgi:hypothetical protein